jgi:hypothetical protein
MNSALHARGKMRGRFSKEGSIRKRERERARERERERAIERERERERDTFFRRLYLSYLALYEVETTFSASFARPNLSGPNHIL